MPYIVAIISESISAWKPVWWCGNVMENSKFIHATILLCAGWENCKKNQIISDESYQPM